MVSARTVNVLMLSVGFMLLFISFQTMANILVTVIASIKLEDKTYTADSLISLAIVYVVLALSNFLAPPFISILGPRISMVCGGLTYTLYIASFLMPLSWVLYVVSAILGFGAAVIWTAQGTYLTQNSDSLTIGRNAGIFWAVFQCSQFLGNLFVFFTFRGKEHIDLQTRTFVYIVLTIVSVIGLLVLLVLRPAVTSEGAEVTQTSNPIRAMKSAFALIIQGRMLLLCITFWYTGAVLTFAGSIYSFVIGSTRRLARDAMDTKPLVGLHGVLFGLGEVIGGAVFGSLGMRTVRWGRNPIIITGCLVFLACYFLIYLNIPNDAFFGDTLSISYFRPPSATIALLCSFLLGFGDSCFNTQIYSIIGTLYRDDSAPAFALFKFVQSVATGLGFVYSKYLELHGFLFALTIMLTLSTITFIFVERIADRMHLELTIRTEESTTTDKKE